MHFLRNASDHTLRKRDDDCLQELRWLCDRRNLEETFAFLSQPLQHHKHLKSTNRPEHVSQEIKRHTLIVRMFPNAQSCMRLVRAPAVEIHEDWLDATRT